MKKSQEFQLSQTTYEIWVPNAGRVLFKKLLEQCPAVVWTARTLDWTAARVKRCRFTCLGVSERRREVSVRTVVVGIGALHYQTVVRIILVTIYKTTIASTKRYNDRIIGQANSPGLQIRRLSHRRTHNIITLSFSTTIRDFLESNYENKVIELRVQSLRGSQTDCSSIRELHYLSNNLVFIPHERQTHPTHQSRQVSEPDAHMQVLSELAFRYRV